MATMSSPYFYMGSEEGGEGGRRGEEGGGKEEGGGNRWLQILVPTIMGALIHLIPKPQVSTSELWTDEYHQVHYHIPHVHVCVLSMCLCVCIPTMVRGMKSGSAEILAMISASVIPKENTSACSQ